MNLVRQNEGTPGKLVIGLQCPENPLTCELIDSDSIGQLHEHAALFSSIRYRCKLHRVILPGPMCSGPELLGHGFLRIAANVRRCEVVCFLKDVISAGTPVYAIVRSPCPSQYLRPGSEAIFRISQGLLALDLRFCYQSACTSLGSSGFKRQTVCVQAKP